MKGNRFDTLIQAIAENRSRRGIMRTLGAGAVAAMAAALGYRQSAVACKKNGKKCDKNSDCCSGTCKGNKKKGRRKCKSTPDAFGCTIKDACFEKECPDDAAGDCAVTIKGKPFCFRDGECFACSSDAECVDELNDPDARCVECPAECGGMTNFRACVSRNDV